MRVYNTLTRQKEEFVPLEPGKVRMYVCGITAYDSCHIGHARAAVVFDTVVRYLKYKGFKVTYVKNYTDVDDKIINRANKERRSCDEIAGQYINEYSHDMETLGNLRPDIEPRATRHIPEMIAAVATLIQKGHAYVLNGDVYFRVRSFPSYGKLSGKNIEELESGARVEINEQKEDPLDFALWKAAKPGEPSFPSPWGAGRPGWHIECSVMSTKYLGQPFDIHGGGQDLIFPHHENEIAQAEGIEDRPFVRYWLHNGFVNINREKMSKSMGNILITGEILKRYDWEAVRYFLLSCHYRSPLDYAEDALAEATEAVDRFYDMVGRLPVQPGRPNPSSSSSSLEKELVKGFGEAKTKFENAMDDDFNTAQALGNIFELVRITNRYLDKKGGEAFRSWLSSRWSELKREVLMPVLGLFGSEPAEYLLRRKSLSTSSQGIDTNLVGRLISEREVARAAKDFAKADEIKRKLVDMGIELRDKPGGRTEWRIK